MRGYLSLNTDGLSPAAPPAVAGYSVFTSTRLGAWAQPQAPVSPSQARGVFTKNKATSELLSQA